MSDADPEWVQVHSCTWLHEAEFVRSLLESEGIDVFIPDEYTLGALYGAALGGVRVLVPRADLDHAKEVLASGSSDDR